MAILKRLARKTALITGAGNGLGAAAAERFGQEGAAVVINYHSEAQRPQVDATIAVIEAAGGRAIGLAGDVTDPAVLNDLFDVAETLGGGLDILVNNAVRMLLKPIADVTEDEFTGLMEVNYKAVFFACGLAAKRMRDNGRII